ncbi:hypothetical protein BRADI_2g05340v3 [Brachypodium distachyon]|uniref:Uncharacterized protein n=1 Tax=Brachypodium distachyon TaxID=15368 RepID=A0A0Q3MF60_BRADI|nr:hypothetical protein BRADI_2g05340v3 [Brachypodium distachyon]
MDQEEGPEPKHGWARPAVLPTILVNAGFAGAVYGAAGRGGARDVALVAADYCVTYYVLAAFCFCLWKLELLRQQRDDPESAAQRRRASIAAWTVSVALGVNIASHVTDATVRYDHLAVKIAVRVLAGVATGVAGYFFFFGHPRRVAVGLTTRASSCPSQRY